MHLYGRLRKMGSEVVHIYPHSAPEFPKLEVIVRSKFVIQAGSLLLQMAPQGLPYHD